MIQFYSSSFPLQKTVSIFVSIQKVVLLFAYRAYFIMMFLSLKSVTFYDCARGRCR